MNHYTGFLNVYKERGMSSMAVCARIRRILDVAKAGHAGTLDPMAEGVLPVALGRACKSCDEAGGGRKTYRAGMLLGVTTDTQDVTGTELSRYEGELPSEEEIRNVLLSFVGDYDQLTPMYSARQVDGKRLYEIAREGKEVERAVKTVEIMDLTIEKIDLPHVVFSVTCSRGTYVRTLCHDAGEKLGCGACMESLVRTSVGDFRVEEALTTEQVKTLFENGGIDRELRVITPTAVAIGKFDGTHLGHRKLLRELRKSAEKHHLRSLVLILDTPGKSVEDRALRKEKILSMGIDYCIEYELDEELMRMSAEAFLKEILIGKLSMKFMVAGKDIAFGKGREGNEEFLRKHAAEYGFTFKLIDKLKDGEDGPVISSTVVRDLIRNGDVEKAGQLLGAPWSVTGVVEHGKHIGTDVLGVPTVNIAVPDDRELPPYGVYVTETMVTCDAEKQIRNDITAPKNKDAAVYGSISNLGVRPTAEDGRPATLETALFGDPGDLYGKTVEIRFLRYLRPERKFGSFEELKEQMTKTDIPEAQKYLQSRK